MGFEGYFLIVADFIAWARDNAIPVGPGRGSGVGSLVAYALGITNLDPLAHDLLFERFLNPERVSLPDFDIDFCIDGRDRVIDYVGRRYGRERVAQIATYGTMAARAVVRDVGRALGLPYGYVDRIAKLIPFEIGITLDKAIADDEELRKVYESDEEVRGLIDLAKRLEGLARNVGTHAGGVVIAPQPITEYMPLYADADGALLTQLDKDDLEAIGLIKFDFLGLKTLTIIDKAVAAINRERAARGEPPLNIDAIPVDDAKTYELLRQCRTTAVFQLESLGMRDLIKRLQPDRFDDLTAIVALFRPGPMQMADEFIARKHRAGATPDYLHPRLETTLKPTYGVILYQEQVMQIAQVLAGYSLGGADLLRRAMGKKKPEEMAEQRSVFLKGATERGVEAGRANHIFDQMETFAGYGFNKSHAAAYALIAYQTAWLKTHYPEAYMAAVLTADLDNTDRLVVLKDELKQHGHRARAARRESLRCCRSRWPGRSASATGLGALKGVGPSAVEAIVAERDAHGAVHEPRRSLPARGSDEDQSARARSAREVGRARLARRESRDADARHPERAASGGTLRARAGGGTDGAVRRRRARGRARARADADPRLEQARASRRRARESRAVLDGPPVRRLRRALQALHERRNREGAAGLAEHGAAVSGPQGGDSRGRRRRRAAARQSRVDRARRRHGAHRGDDVRRGLRASEARHREARGADRRRAAALRRLHQRLAAHGETHSVRRRSDRGVRAPADDPLAERIAGPDFLRELQRILKPFTRGRCEVSIEYRANGAEAALTLGEAWSVRVTRDLRDQLTRLLGDDSYLIHYPKHFV